MKLRPIKLVLISTLIMSLSGCYSVWSDIDSFSKNISCSTTEHELRKSAINAFANVIFDEESQSLQIQKESDTVVVQFDKNKKISRVITFKVKVQFLGMHRKQLAPEVVLECK